MHESERISVLASGQEGLARLLLDRIPDAAALFDRDMLCIACNDRWLVDHCLEREAVIGVAHSQLIPEIGCEWDAATARVLQGESISSLKASYLGRNGRSRWMHWDLTPWYDEGGKVAGLLAVAQFPDMRIARDIHARVVSEEMALFLDIARNFGLCILDDNGLVTIWSAGAERLFGWSEDEALGKPFDFVFEASGKNRGLPQRQLEIARDNGTFRDRCWQVRKDGTRFLADSTISRIEGDGDGGLPSGFGLMVRDVTREDIQARSLEANTELLRSILETVPDAMIVIDDHGAILSVSTEAERMFGYEKFEMIGKNVSMLMPWPDSQMHDGYLAKYRETGEAHAIGTNRRVLGKRKDGTLFPHILRVGEAYGGGQRMFAGFVQDLTETERNEARMQELQRELTHMARISEMGTLSTAIAHELNQPLMAIGNYVQTSAELILTNHRTALKRASVALKEAGRETLRAGEIVQRLRRFVTRGELEKTVEQPEDVARDACKLAASDAKYRNVVCTIESADRLPSILADRVQIKQVLFNLIRNAIEAIDQNGAIQIAIETDGEMVRFTIADDGPGVPPDKVARLFDPFTTTKAKGMGMGLAICRTIVEAHGGKLWHEAGSPRGAQFIFSVPQVEQGGDDGR